MSGYKSTTVRYDRRGELLSNIQTIRGDLAKKNDLLKKRCNELSLKVDELKSTIGDPAIRNRITEYSDILESKLQEIEERESSFEGYSEIPGSSSIGKLEGMQREILSDMAVNQKDIAEISNIDSILSELKGIDEIVQNIKADFTKMENLLTSNAPLLKDWSLQEYERLLGEKEALFERLSVQKKSRNIKLSSIKEVLGDTKAYFIKIESAVVDYTEKDNTARSFKKRIDGLRNDIEGQIAFSKDTVVLDRLRNYLRLLDTRKKDVNEKRLHGVEEGIKEVANSVPLLNEVDKAILETENTLKKIDGITEENNLILKKWVLNEYGTCLKDIDNVKKQLNEYKTELQTKKNISVTKVNEILGQSNNIYDGAQASMSVANEKDKLHQRRLYVIQGLREVCASLGFREMDEPHYKDKDNAYSHVTQNFDTLNLGTITFQVALEGNIESSSGITVDKCDDEFSKVSELLKEQFGIETAFKRIEEGEPIKKYKTAKDLPTSSGKMTQKRSGG